MRKLMDKYPRTFVAAGMAVTFLGGVGTAAAFNSDPYPSALQRPETAAEKLDEMLDVATMAGPVATKWAACPAGPGAEVLPESTHVMTWIFGANAESPKNATVPTIVINNATRYRDTAGVVVAWCGEGIGPRPTDSIHVPSKGTIIVMPNRQPDCPDPALEQQVPCPVPPLELPTFGEMTPPPGPPLIET